jgi:hypothetical protein
VRPWLLRIVRNLVRGHGCCGSSATWFATGLAGGGCGARSRWNRPTACSASSRGIPDRTPKCCPHGTSSKRWSGDAFRNYLLASERFWSCGSIRIWRTPRSRKH